MFLSNKVEQDLFKTIGTPTRYSNLSSNEWKAIRSLVDDRRIAIKMADKSSAVVVWDRIDYTKKLKINSRMKIYTKKLILKIKIYHN